MRLVISAGGTGGHIFPGIAVGEALMAKSAQNSAVYIGTPYGLEVKFIPDAGFCSPYRGPPVLDDLPSISVTHLR